MTGPAAFVTGAATWVTGAVVFVSGAAAFVTGAAGCVTGAAACVAGAVVFVAGAAAWVTGAAACVIGATAFVTGAAAWVTGAAAWVTGFVTPERSPSAADAVPANASQASAMSGNTRAFGRLSAINRVVRPPPDNGNTGNRGGSNIHSARHRARCARRRVALRPAER